MTKLLTIFSVLCVLVGCATGSLPTTEQLEKEHFTECSPDYQLQIQNILGKGLFDPYSAVYAYSKPEKFVYQGIFGYRVFASINAKNRFGGYVGEEMHMFFCFPDKVVREINEGPMGIAQGLKRYNGR
ncbi:MAG: hypothetical protein KA807_10620 [Prolixibacteraceae bacterium]|nr:hypothetical protein [Prolixibacteraceae bacterium]